MTSAIFKAYDVRGIVPDQFDADMARRIGASFARFVHDEDPTLTRVVVARDMRPSGVDMVAAFSEGACSQGLDVVDLGLASTDLLYFGAGSLGRARGHVHRFAQPGAVQRHQVLPIRSPSHR